METSCIKKLLKKLLILKKNSDAILDATGGRFNIFQTVGINHYEKKHSLILSEFLDPYGSHGLKDKFLNLFLKMIVQKKFLFDFKLSNTTVNIEYVIDDGIIDILIKNPEQVIIIENKIYAGDQSEQLIRYNNFAEQNYSKGNFIILYLTLWGDEASKNSCGNVEYKRISYKDDIIKWLEECLKFSLRYPTVRETIIQYINHLKQLTNQDMESKNSKEIVEILAENVESSILIYENFRNMKLMIIENMVKRVAEKFEIEYSFDENGYDTPQKQDIMLR